jgi:hypothetical protein
MHDGWDDERLLVALRDAQRAREAVPPEFVAAAKDAFEWHNIDSELAQLTYDSSHDSELASILRSEDASIRALTFTSARLSIELEVTEDCLLGQVVPAKEGTIETLTKAGVATVVAVDEIGCFCVEPVPAGAFRLRCRTADGTDVVTRWVTLLRVRGQAAPSVRKDIAAACWAGSGGRLHRMAHIDSARELPARSCRCRSTIIGTVARSFSGTTAATIPAVPSGSKLLTRPSSSPEPAGASTPESQLERTSR